MTTSIGSGQRTSGGPVNVTPDRLISFSTVAGAASAPSTGAVVKADQNAGNVPTRYRFRINPDRLSTRHDKNEKYVFTQAGYERQSWGNGLTVFQYSGNSGVFRPETTVQEFLSRFPNGSFDIRLTNTWLRFQEFEDFYRRTGSTNIFMYYDMYEHEWEGSLSQFNFERTANMPFHITYSFTFTALPLDYPKTSLDEGLPEGDVKSTQSKLASTTPDTSSGGKNDPKQAGRSPARL